MLAQPFHTLNPAWWQALKTLKYAAKTKPSLADRVQDTVSDSAHYVIGAPECCHLCCNAHS